VPGTASGLMITSKDKKHMAFVRRLAIDNVDSQTRAKLAACIVVRNDIISIGQNSYKSHPLQKRFSKHIESIFKHAEVDCIINALRHVDADKLCKATLYVYRVKRRSKDSIDWVDGYSEPCPGCKQAISHFKIKKVIFSTDEDRKFISINSIST